MKRKIKALERLAGVRTRLRDAAAADYAAANRQVAEKVDELAAARERKKGAGDAVVSRMELAADVRKLELVRAEMAAAAGEVRRTEAEIQHATMHAQRVAVALRDKERDLRASEKMLGRLKALRARRMDRSEQAMVDDLVASAQWRGGVR